jgi:hypothetical protein
MFVITYRDDTGRPCELEVADMVEVSELIERLRNQRLKLIGVCSKDDPFAFRFEPPAQ